MPKTCTDAKYLAGFKPSSEGGTDSPIHRDMQRLPTRNDIKRKSTPGHRLEVEMRAKAPRKESV